MCAVGDQATIEALLALADVDAIAEAMSTVEWGAWSPTACYDHNKWTWRGDHRTEADRDYYRDLARAVIDLLSAKAEEASRA